MMKAAIDIGTNTTLLLIAKVSNGNLEVLHEAQRIPRLGKGVDKNGRLSDEAMQRVINVLLEYQENIEEHFPAVDAVRVTATSAVRDASNRSAFLDLVAEQTGWQVEILSGFEEAQLTYLGAYSVIGSTADSQHIVIDIGGGSTEVASGGGRIVRDRYSYDMGCVRFTERFLNDDPPNFQQLSECRRAIQKVLEEFEFNFVDEASLTGVAGTVTSLAYIDQELEAYDPSSLDGYEISQATVAKYISRVQQHSSEWLRQTYPTVMEGRADIFLAGLLILEEFMGKYDFRSVVCSTGGIRHGAIVSNSEG